MGRMVIPIQNGCTRAGSRTLRFDDAGRIEGGELLAEVSLRREEAETVMNRAAYNINQVVEDLEGLEPSPPAGAPADSYSVH